MRYCRTDGNQQEIVRVFRDMGCTVAVTSDAGHGFPDIVLGIRGVNLLIELKDGKKSPSQRKLTPMEENFHRNWRGQVCVVTSIEEAVDLINGIKGGKGNV